MKILMTAGMHGDEQDAVLTVLKYKEMISKRDDLDLDVDFLIVNKSGIRYNTREVYHPDLSIGDPNRMFDAPMPTNYMLETSAVEWIKQNLKNYEAVIDVHNSQDVAMCVLLSNNKYARNYVEFCEKYQINYIARESNTDTVKKYANEVTKIPGFTVELGGMNNAPYSRIITQGHVDFIDKLVAAIRKDPDLPDLPNANRDPLFQCELWMPIVAHDDGIVEWLADIGERVQMGETIAKIRKLPVANFNKNSKMEEEVVIAETNGYICAMENMWCSRSEPFGWIQPDPCHGDC